MKDVIRWDVDPESSRTNLSEIGEGALAVGVESVRVIRVTIK